MHSPTPLKNQISQMLIHVDAGACQNWMHLEITHFLCCKMMAHWLGHVSDSDMAKVMGGSKPS